MEIIHRGKKVIVPGCFEDEEPEAEEIVCRRGEGCRFGEECIWRRAEGRGSGIIVEDKPQKTDLRQIIGIDGRVWRR